MEIDKLGGVWVEPFFLNCVYGGEWNGKFISNFFELSVQN